MNRSINVCYFICTIAFISGCSTFSTMATKKYTLKQDGKEGLVIVSFNEPNTANYYYCFRSIADNKYNFLAIEVLGKHLREYALCPLFSRLEMPNEKRHNGRLIVALRLPEGDYEFYRWYDGGGASSVEPFSFRFRAISGKAVYVGGIELEQFTNEQRRKELFTAPFKFVDYRKEDLPEIMKKLPNITTDQIEVNLIELQCKGFLCKFVEAGHAGRPSVLR